MAEVIRPAAQMLIFTHMQVLALLSPHYLKKPPLTITTTNTLSRKEISKWRIPSGVHSYKEKHLGSQIQLQAQYQLNQNCLIISSPPRKQSG